MSMAQCGPMANPRLCIIGQEGKVSYTWQVLYKTVASGCYCTEEIQTYLQQLAPHSGYKLCPGIGQYNLQFTTKNLRIWGMPFDRCDSNACFLWHTPCNSKRPNGDSLRDACAPCKRLDFDIKQLEKRLQSLSEGNLLSRRSSSSNYPIKYLSPKSKSTRIARIAKDRKNLNSKLDALTPFNCELKDKQHSELLELVRSVHKNGSQAIEQLCVEGDKALGEDRNLLRDAWQQDVIERLQHEKDQAKSGE